MLECSSGPLKYCGPVRLFVFECATCQKSTNSLLIQFTDQRLDLKVSSGLHRQQPAASDAGASGSEWEKVSYAAHITNWNRFIIKGFFANVPEHFSYLQTSLTEGVGAAERIGTFILLGFFTIALQNGHTQTLIFTSCFLFWLQQTCVSTGRQPPLQLPAQKWLIFIISQLFLGNI